MIYYVDIDGTICSLEINKDGDNVYENAKPYQERIKYFNNLYDQGHEIHYYTARGSSSGKDKSELTIKQLEEWGVKYTTARTGKPHYDYWIDDKAMNVDAFFDMIELDKEWKW